MNPSIHEPLPPDMLEAERSPLSAGADRNAVPSSLLAPLAARAHGDAVFPQLAAQDAHAARTLARLGVDAAPLCRHRPAIYAELSRTRILRTRAAAFLDRHPRAMGLHLGAGLGHGYQWLDRGTNTWLDAERKEVHALRQQVLPPNADERRLNVACDVTLPGWWQRLGLPSGTYEPPLLMLLDGAALRLEPAQMQAVLREVGEHAPPGTRLLVDTPSRWAPGCSHHALAGPPHRTPSPLQALALPHPRLRLDAAHHVMAGYGWPYSLIGPFHQVVFGQPFHVVAELGVDA
jgi:O-methyltransferase involved in polyketide biosynthesis